MASTIFERFVAPKKPQQPELYGRPALPTAQPVQPPLIPKRRQQQQAQQAPPQQDFGNLGNINTTITPMITYPPELTERARNQVMATQAQNADPRWLMKRFASPGRSLDAGIAQAATPFLSQAMFLGNQGLANISLGDTLANQESLLAGEIGREKEGLGLGNLLARLSELGTTQANSFLSPLLTSLLR